MLWRSSAPARHPPGFIEPCLPTLADAAPSGPQWVHEIKHDGFRFICRREGDRVRVFSCAAMITRSAFHGSSTPSLAFQQRQ
jgi:bifunctional non-homologous end joining protein LigD